MRASAKMSPAGAAPPGGGAAGAAAPSPRRRAGGGGQIYLFAPAEILEGPFDKMRSLVPDKSHLPDPMAYKQVKISSQKRSVKEEQNININFRSAEAQTVHPGGCERPLPGPEKDYKYNCPVRGGPKARGHPLIGSPSRRGPTSSRRSGPIKLPVVRGGPWRLRQAPVKPCKEVLYDTSQLEEAPKA